MDRIIEMYQHQYDDDIEQAKADGGIAELEYIVECGESMLDKLARRSGKDYSDTAHYVCLMMGIAKAKLEKMRKDKE